MNSTHGPFFNQKGNNLPPLSALNKYENSTMDSERDKNGTSHRRALTNMGFTPSQTIDQDVTARIKAHKKRPPNDPFYSQEMVKLSDEAKI